MENENRYRLYMDLFLDEPGETKNLKFTRNLAITAMHDKNGTYRLLATAKATNGEELIGEGSISPVLPKTNPRAPDLRGHLKKPDIEGEWEVAAWWKIDINGQRSLSLTLTNAGTWTIRPKASHTQSSRDNTKPNIYLLKLFIRQAMSSGDPDYAPLVDEAQKLISNT